MNFDGETILIVLTLVVAGVALYKASQRGEIKSFTPSTLVEAVQEARPIAIELKEIAQVAVSSVEQLRREGKIQDNDAAFNRALDLTKKWIPDEWEISNEDIVAAINAAVLVASALSRQAGSSSENAPHTRQPQ